MSTETRSTTKTGQRLALLIAGIGLLWICANFAGSILGWSNRTQALFDLMALAGFGFALWQTYNLWRTRRNDKG
ncbi:MAG: DUF5337 domain-containing protein [Heliomarina sp.]|uniref:DUF5337 domain-containing protein n=1 Tax=Heliomarina sp. TaxID=2917556 RepID=UPI0040597399